MYSLKEFGGLLLVGGSFHLEDEVTIFNVDLRCPKGCRVGTESPVVALLPPVGIERIEVVSPVKIERL